MKKLLISALLLSNSCMTLAEEFTYTCKPIVRKNIEHRVGWLNGQEYVTYDLIAADGSYVSVDKYQFELLPVGARVCGGNMTWQGLSSAEVAK